MGSCIICGNSSLNRLLKAREMLFGTRDEYTYLECSKCGCLQIQDGLSDKKIYPDHYFSFEKPLDEGYTILNRLKLRIRKLNARKCLAPQSLLGSLLRTLRGEHHLFRWLRKANVTFDSDILDIGCGAGHLLLYLRSIGFSSLTGIDPFVREDIEYPGGVKIYKKSIYDLPESAPFDFIMLNDSIEHLPDPVSAFGHLRKLLKPGGHVLVRTPLASSYAFRKYGPAWAAMDAPRHTVIHTLSSMHILADRTGFQIIHVEYDSTEYQFIASEQFCRDIAIKESKSHYISPRDSIFSRRQIRAFAKHARYLNEMGDGDSACFLLK